MECARSMVQTKSPVKVEAERKQGSQVVLSVELGVDDVTGAIERAFNRLASRARIAGFRPGKAPRPIVERHLGWPAIREEALDLLLPTGYQAALEAAGIEAVDQPSVEILLFERNQPFRFKATVPVKPTVQLGDYRSIRAALPPTVVTDADVEVAVDRLRERFAELQVANQTQVQERDVLTVDMQVLEKGVVVVGEGKTDAELHVSREDLLPGLADALLGAERGDTREVVVTLPSDYPKKELAGLPVLFRITVKDIKRRVLPAAEELPKLLARDDTIAELRAEIRQELEQSAARVDQQRFESEVLRQLSEQAQIDVPEALVQKEVDQELREFETRLATQGIRLDRYLAYTNQTMEVLRAERRPLALSRVRVELALEALAAEEGLTVGEEELRETVQKALEGEGQSARQLRRPVQSQGVQQYFRRQLLLRKAAESICTLAASGGSDTMGEHREPR